MYALVLEAFSEREFDGAILPEATLRISCSKGTYVRSLFHDIGKAMGTAACMSELERISYGPLRAKNAVSPEALADRPEAILPSEYILKNYPCAELNEAQAKAYLQGKNVTVSRIQPGEACPDWPMPGPSCVRVRLNGQLFALAHLQGDVLRPWKYLGGL